MKGIILAGGKGTRLCPLTLTTPKPLVAVNKKPLINYNLSLFSEHGVGEIKVIIRPEDREHYRRWHVENASRFPGATIVVSVKWSVTNYIAPLVAFFGGSMGDLGGTSSATFRQEGW